ncbi:MAG: hypothetical protein R3C61_07150 [Bacteroidia bacterium]
MIPPEIGGVQFGAFPLPKTFTVRYKPDILKFKKMKKYLFIIVAAVIFSSCANELDLVAPSELTASGFWDTEEGAITAHTGMYANLRSQAGNFWLLGEMRSDIWGGRTFESPFDISLIES